MRTMTKTASAALVVAVAVSVAGCGDDEPDRLSKQETTQQLNEIFGATSAQIQQQFHPIFAQLEQGRENAAVPDRVRAQLEQPAGAVADELRETADRVEDLEPPADVEDEVDSLVDAARRQAARLEELPAQDGITVRALADAVAPPMQELRRLGEAGIQIEPPRGM